MFVKVKCIHRWWEYKLMQTLGKSVWWYKQAHKRKLPATLSEIASPGLRERPSASINKKGVVKKDT